MAFRCEVRLIRTGAWHVVDEYRGTIGRRMMRRAAYERAMLRLMPLLRTREYRITAFNAPRDQPGIPLRIEIPLPV